MTSFKTIAALALLPVALSVSTPALAGSNNTTMAVSATVLTNCTVLASPLAFGTGITNVGNANIDSTSTISLVCTPNSTYSVALDDGANASSGARRLKGAARGEFLPYEIYTSSGYATRWGQTSGVNTVGGTTVTGLASLTAYGRIPSTASPVSADAYSDTVTVTVNF